MTCHKHPNSSDHHQAEGQRDISCTHHHSVASHSRKKLPKHKWHYVQSYITTPHFITPDYVVPVLCTPC
jgi:hypothetical protein